MSDLDGIHNFRRLDDRITTSGQPSESELRALAADGVTTVVNLGLHEHPNALPDEAASVAAAGMRYVHIPVPFEAPGEDHYLAFANAMATAGGEHVHVHCIANMRVTAFLYRWLIDEGRDEAEARVFMNSVWQPGGAWARFIGDEARIGDDHAGPVRI